MTERIFHSIVGLLFLFLSAYASYTHETFYWAVAIILANMWVISSSFKE